MSDYPGSTFRDRDRLLADDDDRCEVCEKRRCRCTTCTVCGEQFYHNGDEMCLACRTEIEAEESK